MKIMRLKAVMECTGLSRSTLYKMVSEGGFPASISLGERSVGWVSSEVEDWVTARIQARGPAAARFGCGSVKEVARHQ